VDIITETRLAILLGATQEILINYILELILIRKIIKKYLNFEENRELTKILKFFVAIGQV